jgi:hypothetical protein
MQRRWSCSASCLQRRSPDQPRLPALPVLPQVSQVSPPVLLLLRERVLRVLGRPRHWPHLEASHPPGWP